ncbi:MAG: DpnD/PcfM family protein [Moraxellaceae bacterium]
MATFTISIEETLQRSVVVEAKTDEEAYELVKNRYDNEEIVLDSDDFSEVCYYDTSGEHGAVSGSF